MTDSARKELKSILSRTSLRPGKHLRLAMPPRWEGPGDFGVVIDDELNGDQVVEHEGTRVLLVDEQLAQYLSKSTFNFEDSPDGLRFTLDIY